MCVTAWMSRTLGTLLRSARNVSCICVQGREKIHLIETFTDMGFDILVSDVDTVW